MTESLTTTAQLTTVIGAEVTGIAQLRAFEKDAFVLRAGVKLSFLPFFAQAAIEALAVHPVLNSRLNEDVTEVTYFDAVHLGIAVDAPKGHLVPVLRNAQDMPVAGLATAIATSADAARDGRITADALGGGTFTITNTGSRGALFDTPILNKPQTGLLGTGTVAERVIASRDATGAPVLGIRSMIYLALTYDHRLVDGADAARFLATVKTRLKTGVTAGELTEFRG